MSNMESLEHVYSFRVDKNEDQTENEFKKEVQTRIEQWQDNGIVINYLIGWEYAEITQKFHAQGALQIDHELTAKERCKYRNIWKRKSGQISLVKAKKKSIWSYCKKDGDIWTTFNETQLNKIEAWIPKKEYKKTENKKKMDIIDEQIQNVEAHIKEDYRYYAESIVKIGMNNGKLFNKNQIYKYLLKYCPNFTEREYMHHIGLFRDKFY